MNPPTRYGGTTPQEISPPTPAGGLLEASQGESLPPSRLEALLAEAKAIEIPRLKGYSIRLSRYSKRALSRAHPLTGRKKRKKYKARPDMKARRKRKWQAAYKAKALLHEEGCYKFYRTVYGDRWRITPEEWGYIWAEYDLEGSSPVIQTLPGLGPSGDLTPYTILIRSKQERNLRDTIYDGQSREIEDILCGEHKSYI